MGMKITLIFDGDDTLWQTHFLYDQAKIRAVRLLNSNGITVGEEAFINKVDEYSIAFGKEHGFTSNRFPTALINAYKFFCDKHEANLNEETIGTLRNLAERVAITPPKEMPKARELLKSVSARFTCILYTLGNEKQQLFRLNSVCLKPYFHDIFIVSHKDEKALSKILSKFNLDIKLTWMIGNSAKSDIKPALKLGLNCIWLHSAHWLFDQSNIDKSRVFEITSLDEVFPIINDWEKGLV